MIKSVIFDMDGVLIDAREWHFEALNSALEPFGLEITRNDHDARFNGMTTKSKLDILTSEKGLPKDLHRVISAVKQDRTLRIAAAKCYPNIQHIILIQRLKSLGIKVGLYTNSIRQTTEYMLRHAQLLELFDSIITNEDVKHPKPDPEGYLKSCSQLEHLPKNTLVVEDGDYGVISAEKAGCKVFRVLEPKDVSIENLSKFLPALVAQND